MNVKYIIIIFFPQKFKEKIYTVYIFFFLVKQKTPKETIAFVYLGAVFSNK